MRLLIFVLVLECFSLLRRIFEIRYTDVDPITGILIISLYTYLGVIFYKQDQKELEVKE